ncbi:MAG TPA: hypothetical protein VIM62_10485 [Acidobacteriaceae bacterium]
MAAWGSLVAVRGVLLFALLEVARVAVLFLDAAAGGHGSLFSMT